MDTGFYHYPGEMGYVFHWAGRITENVDFGMWNAEKN
jgi:hypothetical protein